MRIDVDTKRRSFWPAVAIGVASTVFVSAGIPEPDLIWYGKVTSNAAGFPIRATSGTLVWQLEPVGGGAPWVVTTQLTNINDQFSFVMRVPCESAEPGAANGVGIVLLGSAAGVYRRAIVTLNGETLTINAAQVQFTAGLNDRGRLERIDLSSGAVPIDTDKNGLPDSWELEHYGQIGVNPQGDTDNDGMTNLEEFRAGTDPKNSQSRFAFIDVSSSIAGVRVRWASQPNRRYRLLRSLNLEPSGFQSIRSGLVATPPANELIDGTVQGIGQFFYRVELEE